jgi:hypothetical protein
MAMVRVLLDAACAQGSGTEEILQASTAVEGLEGLVTGLEAHRLRAEVFSAAVRVARRGQPPRDHDVLGAAFEERALRLQAEEALRACGRSAPTEDEKIAYVDQANRIRPVSLF